MSKQKSKAKKRGKSAKNGRADDSSWVDTDKVVNKAQRIVSSAVNVLEEEIAAGILAAKKIEKKLIDVDEIRSNPDDLMNRIRRDSHEALDLYIDAFAAINVKLNGLIDSLKTDSEEKTAPPKNSQKKRKQDVIVVEADAPLKPGESTVITLSLFEDSKDGSGRIALRKSDFIGQKSQTINQRAIAISPKSLRFSANEEKEVTITIKLPKNSMPGRYNALLTDSYNPLIRIIVSIEVIE